MTENLKNLYAKYGEQCLQKEILEREMMKTKEGIAQALQNKEDKNE